LRDISKNNRIEILAGVGLPVSIIGKTKISTKTTNTFINPNSTDISENDHKVNGGFGIGFQSFAGFNFLVCDYFSAGTEISYGLGYMNAGGKTTITSNKNGTTTTSEGNKLKMRGFKTFGLNGALVLTMNF